MVIPLNFFIFAALQDRVKKISSSVSLNAKFKVTLLRCLCIISLSPSPPLHFFFLFANVVPPHAR